MSSDALNIDNFHLHTLFKFIFHIVRYLHGRARVLSISLHGRACQRSYKDGQA